MSMMSFILKMNQLLLMVFYKMSMKSRFLVLLGVLGIHNVLHLLWKLGYRKAMVKSSCHEAVRINRDESTVFFNHALVFSTDQLLAQKTVLFQKPPCGSSIGDHCSLI
ncbi:hypothetical protein V6N11_035983 [Hibiscus sabdariffa]|uniref:Uncharacterized protein n=1 Tax=Hibiscus sabdariffa TaxID=183260 RepID=A0ABR2R930_9ROSI